MFELPASDVFAAADEAAEVGAYGRVFTPVVFIPRGTFPKAGLLGTSMFWLLRFVFHLGCLLGPQASLS